MGFHQGGIGSGSQFHSTQLWCHTTQIGCNIAHLDRQHPRPVFHIVLPRFQARKLRRESKNRASFSYLSVCMICTVCGSEWYWVFILCIRGFFLDHYCQVSSLVGWNLTSSSRTILGSVPFSCGKYGLLEKRPSIQLPYIADKPAIVGPHLILVSLL